MTVEPVNEPQSIQLKPAMTVFADEYHFAWGDLAVKLVVRDVQRDRGRLNGEVWAYTTIHNEPGLVYWGHHGLDSSRSRSDLVRELRTNFGPRIELTTWSDMVMYACVQTGQAYRSTSTPIELRAVGRRPGARDLFPGLIPMGETTTLVGDGETGKSTLLRLLCLAVVTGHTIAGWRPLATGPALILDYETNQYEFSEAMLALARAIGLDAIPAGLHYLSLQKPLVDEIVEVRAHAARLGAVLVAEDSIVAALRGSASDDDAAKDHMNALRTFGPATRIANTHVTKSAAIGNSEGKKTPLSSFGSRFFFHYSRSQLILTKSDERTVADGSEIDVVVLHNKRNGTKKVPPFLLRWHFTDDDSTIQCERVGETSGAVLEQMTQPERIRYELRAARRALTVNQIAEATGLDRKSLAKAISRMPDLVRMDRDLGLGRGKEAFYGLGDYQNGSGEKVRQGTNGVVLLSDFTATPSPMRPAPSGRFPGDEPPVSGPDDEVPF